MRIRLNLERPNTLGLTNGSTRIWSDLLPAELWLLTWLQSTYDGVDVYTDLDLHHGTLDLARYRALILSTHPEYWTDDMFDKLERYLYQPRVVDGQRLSPGSLLYLGGNGIYRRVRYDAVSRTIQYLQDSNNQYFPPPYSVPNIRGWQFVDLIPKKEEARLLLFGGTYKILNPPEPFRRYEGKEQSNDEWVFENTDLVRGAQFGATGRNSVWNCVGAAYGWETAPIKSDPAIVPLATQSCSSSVRMARLDTPVEKNADGKGGIIFSACSITFGGSLVDTPVLQTMVRNVLSRCGVEPRS